MKAISQLDVYLSNKSDFDRNILGSVGWTRFPRDQELNNSLANEQHHTVLSDLLRGESVLLKREQVLLPVESCAEVIQGKATR